MADMTPEQWRTKLIADLNVRRRDITKLRRYYDGDHIWPLAPDNTTDEYQRMAVLGQANLCANVVDAVTERLVVDGIRIVSPDSDDDLGLTVWRDILQPNRIDAELPVVFEEAVKSTRSFVLVWPAAQGEPPSITGEDPAECIVAYEAGNRRRAVAALKTWREDDGVEYAVLWTTTEVHYWVSKGSAAKGTARWAPVQATMWLPWNGPDEIDTDSGGGPVRENPLGEIPLVEFRSRPRLDGCPQPELSRSVLITQDRINKRLFDSVVVGEYQSFPQRVAIGIEIPTDENGDEVNPLKMGPERTWTLNAEEGSTVAPQVFQLSAADLRQHIDVIQADIKLFAAQSRTPLYQLVGDLVNVSADTIAALEVGLVQKVKRHQKEFGECVEHVVRLALQAAGRDDAAELARTAEVVWADPELMSLAQKTDAAVKLHSMDFPFVAVAEALGETQTNIARLETARASSRLLGAITGRSAAMDPEDMRKRIESLKLLVEAGADRASAAELVGLTGLTFATAGATDGAQ